MATHDEVYAVLDLLIAARLANADNKGITPETLEIYAAMLQDIPADVLRAAAIDCIATSKWWPTIAELRESAVNIMTNANRYPTAMEAWREACKMMVWRGRDWEPEFDNPILQQTVLAMGWRQLCLSTNEIADRARFIQTYEIYMQRARHETQTLPEVRALAARFAARSGLPASQLPALSEPADFDYILDQEMRSAFDRGQGE